jgi:nicotinate-nucleotide pyrophosphorylase (carboxylating)
VKSVSSETTKALLSEGLDPVEVIRVVTQALAEDLGGPDGVDVTSVATIPADQRDSADLVARADGVVAGLSVARAVFDLAGAGSVAFDATVADGESVQAGQVLATVTGPTRALLTAERTALNLLCRLSGVATHTRAWADALAGTNARVLDTRKTTPGLRALEKAAVAAGGATNHRAGLYDAILIKENHAAMAGGVAAAVQAAHAAAPDIPLQVECRNLAEVDEALRAGAPRLLLDNMTPAELRDAVEHVAGRAELEASGGVTLETIREIAESGVHFVSVGALTHSAPALDLSLILEPLP